MTEAVDKVVSIGAWNLAPAFGFIAGIALAGLLVRWMKAGTRSIPVGYQIIALYTLLAAVSIVSLGKVGGASNYFIPFTCGIALLIGLAVAETARGILISGLNAVVCTVLLVVSTAQSLIRGRRTCAGGSDFATANRDAGLQDPPGSQSDLLPGHGDADAGEEGKFLGNPRS